MSIGLIGGGVMGLNLALNLSEKGTETCLYDLDPKVLEGALEDHPELKVCFSLSDLVLALPRPRRVLLMIPAGPPVDAAIRSLLLLLEEGDLIMDGGNSWFEDTTRRRQQVEGAGLHYLGVGISGGEAGARKGPSMMSGGSEPAYALVSEIFQEIAAAHRGAACAARLGPDGTGHLVKTIHNGIEYAVMQLLAESYDLLKTLGALTPPALSEIYQRWNKGPLSSFLVELTAEVFKTKDPLDERRWLVDQVLDKGGQKGTGRWVVELAAREGVAVPTIAAAVNARLLSSQRALRQEISAFVRPPQDRPFVEEADLIDKVHDALCFSIILSHVQGLAFLKEVAEKKQWALSISEVGRVWGAGSILRSRILEQIMDAISGEIAPRNLLLLPALRDMLLPLLPSARETLSLAVLAGLPAPALGASLSYFESLCRARLPQNLTQAQRDAFGAHTYQRLDDPEGGFVHSKWGDGE